MPPPDLTIRQALEIAVQHHQAGQIPQAEYLYRQVLERDPAAYDALHLLGVIASQTGRTDDAVALIRQAIALNPNWPQAYSNLAVALLQQGRADDAIAAWRQAATLAPGFTQAWNHLGDTLRDLGRADEALNAYRQSLFAQPQQPEVRNNIGVLLRNSGQPDEAIAAYGQALALRPGDTDVYNNLGNALRDTGQLDEAIAAYRQAAAGPRPEVHGNLIFALHFHPAYDAAAILAEHRAWNDRFAQPLRASITPHTNDRSSDRRLRIGYVSGDFRQHAVSWVLEPILAHHDPIAFEVFCYSNVRSEDDLSRRLRQRVPHWRPIFALDDEKAAALIREDAIDILVDLAAHSANHRILLFARKPAPVQVTHIAYPATTGLSAIDYRITDEFLDPPGLSEAFNSETLVRLPRCWYSYVRPDEPAVCALPALAAGHITFASLNNLAKITPPVIELWSRVLQAVPSARLLIGPGQPRRWEERFQQHGVNPKRISLAARTDAGNYLQPYQDIDIALDPFPFNGGTVTCDALWMGVPVVTLRGQTSVGRAGVSILSAVGLPELIADTPDDYVNIASALAENLPRLQDLRAGLRARMRASPLADAAGYTRDLEAAYRDMWRKWSQR